MGSLNRVELIGNLGKDPDVKQLENGNKVASFTLATTEPAVTLKDGTQVPPKTEWHNIVAWGGSASIAERFLRKGVQVYVDGKLRYRSYEKNEQKYYVTEVVCDRIVLLSSQNRAENAVSAQMSHSNPQSDTNYHQQGEMPTEGDYATKNDDDLPF